MSVLCLQPVSVALPKYQSASFHTAVFWQLVYKKIVVFFYFLLAGNDVKRAAMDVKTVRL